ANEGAEADLVCLVLRLQKALDAAEVPGLLGDAEKWHKALRALLPPSSLGIWPAEARLLYDLQKICVDHERPIYAPDLVEWAYSYFRAPLVRPLPNEPLVLAVKHLRIAHARLSSARITDAQRKALGQLLRAAMH